MKMSSTTGRSLFLACLLFVLLGQISGGFGCTDWCVARSDVPDAVIQKSLDWICTFGKIGCTRVGPGQPCYKPDDLRAVASAAFNDYYQFVKQTGGACDIFGAATLVHNDPSHDSCPFPCT